MCRGADESRSFVVEVAKLFVEVDRADARRGGDLADLIGRGPDADHRQLPEGHPVTDAEEAQSAEVGRGRLGVVRHHGRQQFAGDCPELGLK